MRYKIIILIAGLIIGNLTCLQAMYKITPKVSCLVMSELNEPLNEEVHTGDKTRFGGFNKRILTKFHLDVLTQVEGRSVLELWLLCRKDVGKRGYQSYHARPFPGRYPKN